MDIVVTKWIALEGTAKLATERETELRSALPDSLVEAAKEMSRFSDITGEKKLAQESKAQFTHPLNEGGLYLGLWKLCEMMGTGLEADLDLVPIRQETVEICEHFELDPYMLLSGGSLLIAHSDGRELVRELLDNDIHAAVIGHTTKSKARIIRYDGVEKYLSPRVTDEIFKVL